MSTSRVFFGWWVTLSFAVMAFLSTGIRFAVGPFLKPMVADLGLDRASFSLVVAISLLLYGVMHEATGGYAAAFGLASALLVIAALLSVAIDEQPRAVALPAIAGGE